MCIDLLRHGEPAGGERYRGSGVDDPLSACGLEQMWQAVGGRGLTSGPWDQVVSSPMRRCLAFAESLSLSLNLPLTQVTDLREVGFGSWEGRTPADIRQNSPDEFFAFFRDPMNARPLGAEPLEAFRSRVDAALLELSRSHAGEHLLVVTHAGVIRAAICHVLDVPTEAMYRIRVPYAGITRLRQDDRGMMLEFVNRPGL
ncbi:histidine phosphatase family protein [Ectothiorhodospira shaposhnikovii]|uniref:histidine phosphatase family protein n=1 Tax=Ectothiorhodospira shaposhnikovii TaxID=1054 RepID=UPI001907D033|nr:histidine phosphatase family protein [Ectothiorhodospira shaposhnikovii]